MTAGGTREKSEGQRARHEPGMREELALVPCSRIKSKGGGRGEEVSGPEETWETWNSRKGAGWKGKMLSVVFEVLRNFQVYEWDSCWAESLKARQGGVNG